MPSLSRSLRRERRRKLELRPRIREVTGLTPIRQKKAPPLPQAHSGSGGVTGKDRVAKLLRNIRGERTLGAKPDAGGGYRILQPEKVRNRFTRFEFLLEAAEERLRPM
jgi:hypothetical protein